MPISNLQIAPAHQQAEEVKQVHPSIASRIGLHRDDQRTIRGPHPLFIVLPALYRLDGVKRHELLSFALGRT